MCKGKKRKRATDGRPKAFPSGEGAERSEADEGRGAVTNYVAFRRVLHALIRPFGPPSPKGRHPLRQRSNKKGSLGEGAF